MHHWIRVLFAIGATLLITGCLWGPGKFASDLTLRKDGSFTLDYRGEIVLQLPPDAPAEPWRDAQAKCEDDGKPRPCTKAEIAEKKADYDKKRREAPIWPRCSGFPGSTMNPTGHSPSS